MVIKIIHLIIQVADSAIDSVKNVELAAPSTAYPQGSLYLTALRRPGRDMSG